MERAAVLVPEIRLHSLLRMQYISWLPITLSMRGFVPRSQAHVASLQFSICQRLISRLRPSGKIQRHSGTAGLSKIFCQATNCPVSRTAATRPQPEVSAAGTADEPAHLQLGCLRFD